MLGQSRNSVYFKYIGFIINTQAHIHPAKKIAAQRITKSNIFWNYERLLKRGIDYDNREEMYNEIQSMTMEDVTKFFDSNVKGQDFSISVIGNKNDLDMESLKKLGEVHEMDIDYLFNYKEIDVKQ